jgi:hypothetical protein
VKKSISFAYIIQSLVIHTHTSFIFTITTINDFLQEHDKGQQVDIAILDFSKAFDTVPHDKLLHKLEQDGIKGKHPLMANQLPINQNNENNSGG